MLIGLTLNFIFQVLADGKILDCLSSLQKDNTGLLTVQNKSFEDMQWSGVMPFSSTSSLYFKRYSINSSFPAPHIVQHVCLWLVLLKLPAFLIT